jgi:murein DD-endopeptidase MepM/ murein hydrolase activator NlpD
VERQVILAIFLSLSLFAHGDTVSTENPSGGSQSAEGAKVSTVLPVNSCITSSYGMRTVKRMKKRGRHHHSGVDFRAPVGTPVRACGPGTVTEVGANKRCGQYVEIKLDSGLYAHYCHLSSAKVKTGAKVDKDAVVALSGQSGDARKNPHLHFVIKKQPGMGTGSDVDPMNYLPPIAACN